ncbi:MAG: DUF4956 domain-containing protein [Deltaproteobacteria bacterium]|nr:DUF4956 domain-containing protein [Deltaproteobacteria bacterium]
MDQLAQLLSLPAEASNLAIPTLLLNLLLGAALGGLLRAQYVRFSGSLANRELFARNFIPIILAVTLIIMVVKASLALSLGLVGALSIVRFRTPIKDPEELVYLFLAIAIGLGLGLGAEQSVATVASIALILTILTLLSWKRGEAARQALYLEIELAGGAPPDSILAQLSDLLRASFSGVNLRRFDTQGDAVMASFSVSCAAGSGESIEAVSDAIRSNWPAARVTFLDQDHVPGV